VGAGAKFLGPITVGENARIGSNAVVTKEVPEAVTVVGIPGRIVRKASTEQDSRRKAMAEKIGFDAYGIADEMPDPIARSIHNMMDHMHAVDRKIDTMCKALSDMGDNTCSEALPQLEQETFVSLTEDSAEPIQASELKDEKQANNNA